jgi:biotin carboxyl carrier protein
MKSYRVTVNGVAYDVTVEETGVAGGPAAAAPAARQAPASAPPPAGGEAVVSPLPGAVQKILVKAGESVKKGQSVVVIEAMKMESEVPCPRDGVIASIAAREGAAVETGDTLLTLI